MSPESTSPLPTDAECPAPDAADARRDSKPLGTGGVNALAGDLLRVGLRLVTALEVQNHRLGELIDLILLEVDRTEDTAETDETPTVGLDGLPIPRRGGPRA